MNTFALEIWDDESTLVTFYTVRMEDNDLSETDKFMLKFKGDAQYGSALQEMVSLLLEVMGEEQGAHPAFFSRRENWAVALPPSKARIGEITLNYPEFPLRLFCYRVNDELVILFNGGPKTAASAQGSEDLNMPFLQANEFARRIGKAFDDKLIVVDQNSRVITDFQGNTEIFL
ncbi:MAG: hypothetical protein JNJ90_18485 [Saprospiraceae bacterium]|jgi:hypothetical protein|nr:hypothetical protein [Saprospiraceae bacterium]